MLSDARIRTPLVLAVIWTVAAIIVDFRGDFPLNDDWASGITVYSLVKNGTLMHHGWMDMTLVAQVFWGALFCLPAGFSFTALRLSTLALGLIGIIATYVLLREVGADRTTAFIGALAVAFNPLFFNLSYTFLTDVPFYSLSVLSFLFYIRGVRYDSMLELAAGTIFAALAALIRQPGLLIPFCFGIAYIIKKGIKPRFLLLASVPVAFVSALLFAYDFWLKSAFNISLFVHPSSEFIEHSVSRGPWETVLIIYKGSVIAFVYLGLSLLPLLLLLLPGKWKAASSKERTVGVMVAVVSIAVTTTTLAAFGRYMPLVGNILYNLGLGAPALRDYYILYHIGNLPKAPETVWLVVTAAGVLGAALLHVDIFSCLVGIFRKQGDTGSPAEKWLVMFIILSVMIYFLPHMFKITDRYFIFLIPLMMVIALSLSRIDVPGRRAALATSLSILLVYGIFSIGGTHDYLSWNRARWKAIEYLTNTMNVPPEKVDGGFEFNALLLYNPNYEQIEDKSWWWVVDDEYVVSFGSLKDKKYRLFKYFPYKRWIPYGESSLVVSERQTSPEHDVE
jgi:hypothetical protein